MVIHVFLGLMWAWFLRELWHELNAKWIITAAIGSVLPDVDHLLYYTTYGKRELYTKVIVKLIKYHMWRLLVRFVEWGHKYNVNLLFHNFYVMAALVALTVISYLGNWRFGVILLGAMVTHFVFDAFEDLLLLGRFNPNWMRWGRGKRRAIKFSFKNFL